MSDLTGFRPYLEVLAKGCETRARPFVPWPAATYSEVPRAPSLGRKPEPQLEYSSMTIGNALVPEFDQEMATTRRLLERVPSDNGEWKPHPKSFALGHLAQLISSMPGWITSALQQDSLDLARGGRYTFQPTKDLLRIFDENVRTARAALSGARDSQFSEMWSLKHGDRVLFSAPRGIVVRQNINHLVHHRGQLTVYLRLLDIPIPSIYGPTADEAAF